MELLVVLAILGLLMSLVGPQVLNQLGGAKTKTAAIQIKDLEQALEMYKLDVGRFPSTNEGLQALVKLLPGKTNGFLVVRHELRPHEVDSTEDHGNKSSERIAYARCEKSRAHEVSPSRHTPNNTVART